MQHPLSPSDLEGLKESFTKNHIVYETDKAYEEAANNLVEFIELLLELDRNQKDSPAEHANNEFYFLDEKGRKIIL